MPSTIEEDSWLPGNAIVLPGMRIRHGSTVSLSTGSMVRKDIPPGCLMAGNPARVICVMDKDAVKCFQRAGGRNGFGDLEIQRSFCCRERY